MENIKGSKWWKFDFHNHTPASDDYGIVGDSNYQENKTPRKWLLEYMAKEIDCVAITDHNSGDWIDILKEELQKMKGEDGLEGYRPLYLFPGVEISVMGNIHLLALLDPSKTTSDIDSLIGAVEYKGRKGYSDGVTTKSIEECIRIVNERGVAIPAHADRCSGIFEESRGTSLLQTFNNQNVLAVEIIDKNCQLPPILTDKKISFTRVLGSDSHNHARIGDGYSWVKMETPDIEGLRLALHDGKDGVLTSDDNPSNPNNRNEKYISKIKISKAKIIGNEADLEIGFSPHMNCIIGSFGSGKSSILNFIRYGLNKDKGMPESIQKNYDRFIKKCEYRGDRGMLKNETSISLEYLNESITYKLDKDSESNCMLGIGDDQKSLTHLDEKMLPVQIFSQKELYEITEQPKALLELIDNQIDIRKWSEEDEKIQKQYLDICEKQRELQSKVNNEGAITIKLQTVQQQYEFISGKGGDAIKKFKIVKEKTNKVKTVYNQVKENVEAVEQIKNQIHKIDLDEFSLDSDSKAKLQPKISNINSQIKSIKKLIKALKTEKGELKELIKDLPLIAELELATKNKEKVESKLREEGIALSPEELLKETEKHKKKLTEIEKHKVAISTLNKKKETTIDSFISHQKELRSQREKVINDWNLLSNDYSPSVIIKLNHISSQESEPSFREIISRPNQEFANDIYNEEEEKGFIYEIMNETDNDEKWNLLKRKKEAIINHSDSFGGNFKNLIERLQNETPEQIDKIELWVPEDKISVQIKRNPSSTPEEISNGSAGQRTAGILSVIMNSSDVPLIIDQPEDDLDSNLITELIVKSLRTIKNKRQVILVTHNPNIAVNSSVEQIIQMAFENGQIIKKTEGSLQKLEIRKAICEIMEGGEDALKQRYNRIYKAIT